MPRPTSLLIALGLSLLLPACGDDDGQQNQNNNNNDSPPICGDRRQTGDEECDDGPQNSDLAPDACRSSCRRAHCGDGVVDTGEDCDDGNPRDEDSCLTTCVWNVCGDGVLNRDVPTGEGSPLEACDDGNTADGDGCRGDCGQDLTLCGNGALDQGEACDLGGLNSDTTPDACRRHCQLAACGDGVQDRGEVCDDGNRVDGDGCSADCLSTEICGDGYLSAAAGEACDGAALGGLTCLDLGWAAGVLACHGDCTLDTHLCFTCGNGTCERPEDPLSCPADCDVWEPVDVLFVIDDSGSMTEEQQRLQAELPQFFATLRDPVLGLPDLHVGVTSTNLGIGPYSISYCESSDLGNLLTGACPDPVGAPYLVDRAPVGCDIQRDAQGTCLADDCTQAHCPEGTLATDAESGCPRCRNWTHSASLEDAAACILDLGNEGCGFEQHLEAMYQALDDNPHNAGFHRPESILAVIFVTDGDDCSASDVSLFDTSQNDLNSPLGPLTGFRCFEFGVTCDIDDRLYEGLRQNCAPRTDPGALLHPISRYVDFLHGLKYPDQLLVAAIAGPVFGHAVPTGRDGNNWPMVLDTCVTPDTQGQSSIRLYSFIEEMQGTADMGWAHQSICTPTYSWTLQILGQRIRQQL